MGATEIAEAVLAFSTHEHRDLARGIDRVHEAGCTIGNGSTMANLVVLRDVLLWTRTALEPHLAWEEAWLYPRIEELTGTPWATQPARYQHGQVRDQVERLRRDELAATRHLSARMATELRCRLFSLEALVRAHVENEEWLLRSVLLEPTEPVAAGHGERRSTRPAGVAG